MANSPQARKRARQAVVRRARNVAKRSDMRTAIKKVVNAIDSGDKNAASELYTAAVPVVDAMAGQGIIHRNKAARFKSRLNARIRAMA